MNPADNFVKQTASECLSVDRLSKAYGEKQVLADFSFDFRFGRSYCIMAPSGTGKTTLLRILLGLESPDSGTIKGLEGKETSAVFQEDRLLPGYSALQNIRFVTGNRFSRQELTKTASRLLPASCLDDPVRTFSGGMKRRTAILRAILAPAQLVIMDEPFSGLDHETKLLAIALIREFCRGKLLITATHAKEDAELLGAELLHIPTIPMTI